MDSIAQLVVKLDIRDRGDVFSVRSDQVPGLHCYSSTMELLHATVLRAVPVLLHANRGLVGVQARLVKHDELLVTFAAVN